MSQGLCEEAKGFRRFLAAEGDGLGRTTTTVCKGYDADWMEKSQREHNPRYKARPWVAERGFSWPNGFRASRLLLDRFSSCRSF